MTNIIRYQFLWNEAKDLEGRDLGFFGYKEGQPLSLAFEGDIEVPNDADEHFICEKLFHIFNTEERPSAYVGPSMSVGSVVKVGDVAMGCAVFGFEAVDISKSKIVACNPRWRR